MRPNGRSNRPAGSDRRYEAENKIRQLEASMEAAKNADMRAEATPSTGGYPLRDRGYASFFTLATKRMFETNSW
jgi:hypothetical protein